MILPQHQGIHKTPKGNPEKEAVLLREMVSAVDGGVGLQDTDMINIDLEDRPSIIPATAIIGVIIIITEVTTEVLTTKMAKNVTKKVNREVLSIWNHQHVENLIRSMIERMFQLHQEDISHDHGIFGRRVIMGD
jgi:hypothetical protein